MQTIFYNDFQSLTLIELLQTTLHPNIPPPTINPIHLY